MREERLLKKREEEGEEAELSEEEEEEEEEGEEAAEGQEEEGKPKGPSPVLKGFYYGAGREFWLSMVSVSATGETLEGGIDGAVSTDHPTCLVQGEALPHHTTPLVIQYVCTYLATISCLPRSTALLFPAGWLRRRILVPVLYG